MEGQVPGVSDGASSSSGEVVSSESEAKAGPSAAVFLVPAIPKPKQPSIIVSEDIKDHYPSCCYFRWDQVHRQSLLKSEDAVNYLVNFTVRTRGKNKMAGLMDQILKTAQETVASPIVSNYLKGSHAKYESFKQNALKNCKCPMARKKYAEPEPCPEKETIPETETIQVKETVAEKQTVADEEDVGNKEEENVGDKEEENVGDKDEENVGDKEAVAEEEDVEMDMELYTQQPPPNAVELDKKAVFAICGLELSSEDDDEEGKGNVVDDDNVEMDMELDIQQPPPNAVELDKETLFASCGLELSSEDDEQNIESHEVVVADENLDHEGYVSNVKHAVDDVNVSNEVYVANDAYVDVEANESVKADDNVPNEAGVEDVDSEEDFDNEEEVAIEDNVEKDVDLDTQQPSPRNDVEFKKPVYDYNRDLGFSFEDEELDYEDDY